MKIIAENSQQYDKSTENQIKQEKGYGERAAASAQQDLISLLNESNRR
jgi:hypothetical protein